MLSNEEKAGVVTARLKNIESSIYDVELSIAEENAIEAPSSEVLAALQSRMSDLNARKAVLQTKLEELA